MPDLKPTNEGEHNGFMRTESSMLPRESETAVSEAVSCWKTRAHRMSRSASMLD